MRLAGMVLAGGASRRMGRPKALLPWSPGNAPARTFIDSVLEMLRVGGATDLYAVLGHDPAPIRAGAALENTTVIHNPDHALGQFSSLRAGVFALPPDTAAVIVALVDQPQVPAEVAAALVARFAATRAPIVRPVHAGRGGHPLLLSAETFPALLALPPTATTYDLVKAFADRRVDVPVASPEILRDFDTPEDLAGLE